MFKPKHKRAVGCSEFKETVQLNLYGFFFFLKCLCYTIEDACLQHEANVDVWLRDGTLCLLQQMALIHIN